MSDDYSRTKQTDGNESIQIVAYRAVLSDAKGFLALPSRAGAYTVDKAEEKKAAALAVLVEAFCELEEWDELLTFTQVMASGFRFRPLRARVG